MSEYEGVEQIWTCIRKTSLLRHICYSRKRLPKHRTAKHLPEIMCITKTFGPKSNQQWTDRMLQHNALLRRGGSNMRLHRRVNVAKLMHCSLDLFMLQMHSQQVAEALDSLSTFGERVLPIIKQDPDSRDWWLCPELLIDRRHWLRLSRRVMNLVHLLGIDVDREGRNSRRIPAALNPWPDFPKLLASVRRARCVFEEFASPDREQRTLLEVYWPS